MARRDLTGVLQLLKCIKYFTELIGRSFIAQAGLAANVAPSESVLGLVIRRS